MSRSDYKNLYEGYLDNTGYNNRNIRENYSNYDNCNSNLMYYSPGNATQQKVDDKMYFYFSDKENSTSRICENSNILKKSDSGLQYFSEIIPKQENCCIHDPSKGGEVYDITTNTFKIPTKFYYCNDYTCDAKSANKNNRGPHGLDRSNLSSLHPVCRNNNLFNGTTKEIQCPAFKSTETNPTTECCDRKETYNNNSKNFTVTFFDKGLQKCTGYTCPQPTTRNIEPSKDCESKTFVLHENCKKTKGSAGSAIGTKKTLTRSFIKKTNFQCPNVPDIIIENKNQVCPIKDNPIIKNV
jgi:hypothetical protein